MKGLFLVLVTLLATGCATQPPTPLKPTLISSETVIDGTTRVAQIGDVVFEQTSYLKYKAIDLQKDINAGGGIYLKLFIPAQLMLAEAADEKYEYYFAKDVTTHDVILGTSYSTGGLRVLKEGALDEDAVQLFAISPQTTFPKNEELVFEFTEATRPSDSGYSKRLLFVGMRNGNVIFKYLERKFGEDNFQFDLEYNLAEGNIFNIKGAEIEILEVTSTSLNYRILEGFSN